MKVNYRDRLYLSSYRITWVEFRPTTRHPTKGDLKVFDATSPKYGYDTYTNCFYKAFCNKQAAEAFVNSICAKRLSKDYEARFFTDKQFSMRLEKERYRVPFTKMQEENLVSLKRN